MGFAEQSNSSIRSNRAPGNRMHKRVKRVLESSGKLSKRKSIPPPESEKKLSTSQLNDLKLELKQLKEKLSKERSKSILKEILAALLAIIFFVLIWCIFQSRN